MVKLLTTVNASVFVTQDSSSTKEFVSMEDVSLDIPAMALADVQEILRIHPTKDQTALPPNSSQMDSVLAPVEANSTLTTPPSSACLALPTAKPVLPQHIVLFALLLTDLMKENVSRLLRPVPLPNSTTTTNV